MANVDMVLSTLPGNMKSLSEACLVVDALGPLARKELLEMFVQLQLVAYEHLFGVERAHYGLDQVGIISSCLFCGSKGMVKIE